MATGFLLSWRLWTGFKHMLSHVFDSIKACKCMQVSQMWKGKAPPPSFTCYVSVYHDLLKQNMAFPAKVHVGIQIAKAVRQRC